MILDYFLQPARPRTDSDLRCAHAHLTRRRCQYCRNTGVVARDCGAISRVGEGAEADLPDQVLHSALIRLLLREVLLHSLVSSTMTLGWYQRQISDKHFQRYSDYCRGIVIVHELRRPVMEDGLLGYPNISGNRCTYHTAGSRMTLEHLSAWCLMLIIGAGSDSAMIQAAAEPSSTVIVRVAPFATVRG